MSQPPATSGAIDLANVSAREAAEAATYQKPRDRRYKTRKERTSLISFRIKPAIRTMMEKMADAEGKSMVDILEEAVELKHRVLKGERL
jgi:hypothetical protein